MSGSERVVLAVVFALYCAVVITGAVVHEPWWDEAQPWLIARDASVSELFMRVVRYEGHPPLWFLLLAVPAKLGLPYWTMKIAGILYGAITVLLLLYGFPRVPLYIRILAPFAFFIAYQYTVAARSYVLIGTLLLTIARIYDQRAERFGTFVTLLIALSHVSVHGFAIACALMVVGAPAAGRPVRQLPAGAAEPAAYRPASGRRSIIAFILNAIFLVILLWPPADLASQPELHDVLSPRRHFFVLSSLVPALFWNPATDETMTQAVIMGCAALAALAILVVWFWRNGVAAPFLAGAAATLLVAARYYRQWHEGIFFFLLLFAIVLAMQRRRAPRWLEIAAQVVIVLLLARHAQWTFQSLAYDIHFDFTGSARTARFLSENRLDRRVVYGTGIGTVELQPYFDRNLFANYRAGHAYWDWSSRNDWPRHASVDWLRRIVTARPEVIVCGISSGDDHRYAEALLRYPGYRSVAAFSGNPFWKTQRMRGIAFVVFQRSSS